MNYNNDLEHAKAPLLYVPQKQASPVAPQRNLPLNALNCVEIGDTPLPFVPPNINPRNEVKDIEAMINNSKEGELTCCDFITMFLTSLTGIGICYVYNKNILINNNQYGFIENNGQVAFLKPGRHYIGYPLMKGLQVFAINSDHIKVNNLQLIRINQDEIGVAVNNTAYEILLPGTHLRLNGAFKLLRRQKLNFDLEEGPMKIKTVKTGTVCVCYNCGVAEILTQGRYAINNNNYLIGNAVDITQQNLKFSKHKVLLEGGINMLVEGLLTYQVTDVVKLVKNVEISRLNRYLEDVMKADLTKVFSVIHLEQIAATSSEMKKGEDKAKETRMYIYESIMKLIKPQAEEWGITVINFQLESTQLADLDFSKEYENASLQIGKAKAELRSQEAQNNMLIQKAVTNARIAQVSAESERDVKKHKAQATADTLILEAEARATAIKREGEAKAFAASLMTSEYGQEIALLSQKRKIAEGLKMHTLVMGGDKKDGKSMIDQIMPVLNL